jgi:hypothetical protein
MADAGLSQFLPAPSVADDEVGDLLAFDQFGSHGNSLGSLLNCNRGKAGR